MSEERTNEIRSLAIGQRIAGMRYDAESGYVVIELDSGDELRIAARYEEGYHVVYAVSDKGANNRLPPS